MSTDLKHRLRALRTTERLIEPDAAWVLRTRKTLLMQMTNSMSPERLSWQERARVVLGYFGIHRVYDVLRKPVMSAVSILSVVMGGSIMSVSAAERSLPGDFFYGLKIVTEQAHLALTATKQDKLKLKSEYTNRRVSELKKIAKSPAHQPYVKEATETLKRDLNTLKEQLNDVKKEGVTEDVVEAAKLVDQQTTAVIVSLQETKNDLPQESKEGVTEAQSAAADASVKAIEMLAEKHQESSDNVSADELSQAIQDHTRVVTEVTLLSGSVFASSTASSGTAMFNDIIASSTALTTSTLPTILTQVKDLTEQAFAQQKALDESDLATSIANDAATSSSTPSTATTTSSTAAEPAPSSTTTPSTTITPPSS